MRLIDIVNNPWAVTPEMLREIVAVYATHLRGEKIDIKAIEARMGRPLENKADRGYEIVNRTAVIPVEGVLTKRAAWFHSVSGMSSYELIIRDFHAAMADSQVDRVLFRGDTPGGTVDGIEQATNAVYEARGKKPIITLCDGQLCSAGYWFGSASDEVYIADGTSAVGSIGVIATHVDVSKAEQMYGIKTTEITAGKYKRIASEHAPLSKEGREYIQERVDYLYSIFVDTVARNRGVSAERVLADMADGKVFLGRQAIDAGLVDGMKTFEQLLEPETAVAVPGYAAQTTAEAGSAEAEEGDDMKPEEIKTKYPEAYKAIFAEGAAKAAEDMMPTEDCEKKKMDAKQEGAVAERGRIKAVLDLGAKMPGHSDLVNALAFDGKTTAAAAAIALVDAEGAKKKGVLEALKGAAPAMAASPAAPDIEKPAAEAEDTTLPVEERAKAAWEKDPKVRAEFTSLAAYTAFRKAEANGQVRIFGKSAPKE